MAQQRSVASLGQRAVDQPLPAADLDAVAQAKALLKRIQTKIKEGHVPGG